MLKLNARILKPIRRGAIDRARGLATFCNRIGEMMAYASASSISLPALTVARSARPLWKYVRSR